MCAKDHGILILIIHKSTRSENPITWNAIILFLVDFSARCQCFRSASGARGANQVYLQPYFLVLMKLHSVSLPVVEAVSSLVSWISRTKMAVAN